MHDSFRLKFAHYLRQQAIRLRQQGKCFIAIGEDQGVDRNTAQQWWKQYEQDGEAELNQQARGRKPRDGQTLSQDEENTLQRLMREHLPEEIEIDSALWTRRAVQALICAAVWSQNANSHSRRVAQTLGRYAAKTFETRLRTRSKRPEGMVRADLSPDSATCC